MAFVMILMLLVFWVAPIWVATSIGKSRGRQLLGFLLGIVLGWIGVIIIAVLEPTAEFRREMDLKDGFPCPFCMEPVRTGASVCPHCRRDLPPPIH